MVAWLSAAAWLDARASRRARGGPRHRSRSALGRHRRLARAGAPLKRAEERSKTPGAPPPRHQALGRELWEGLLHRREATSPLRAALSPVRRGGLLRHCAARPPRGPSGVTIAIVRKDLIGAAQPITPIMLDFKTHADNASLYNTPPCFAIYICGLAEVEKKTRTRPASSTTPSTPAAGTTSAPTPRGERRRERACQPGVLEVVVVDAARAPNGYDMLAFREFVRAAYSLPRPPPAAGFFGAPTAHMGLRHVAYTIAAEESTLYDRYGKNHRAVRRDEH